jgi:hypothetical protein
MCIQLVCTQSGNEGADTHVTCAHIHTQKQTLPARSFVHLDSIAHTNRKKHTHTHTHTHTDIASRFPLELRMYTHAHTHTHADVAGTFHLASW